MRTPALKREARFRASRWGSRRPGLQRGGRARPKAAVRGRAAQRSGRKRLRSGPEVRTVTAQPAILSELLCILGAAGGGDGFAYPCRLEGPELRAPHCARARLGLGGACWLRAIRGAVKSVKSVIIVKDVSQCSASGGPLRAPGP